MIRGVLMDIAGVLYDGDHAIAGAADAVSRLRHARLPIRFLTNSTRRPKRQVLKKLAAFGIEANETEVMTPARAACDWLTREGYSAHLVVHPDLNEDFADLPTGRPIAVVVGDAGPYFTYDRLNAAFRHLVHGAPLLALAANRMFRDMDGELSLDAGAFVRGLEFSSGASALLMGKPAQEFFLAGAHDMNLDLSEIVMIGDDAESDIAGALAAGADCGLLVRTGKYRAGDAERFEPRPTAIAADVSAAVDLVLSRID